LGPKTQTSAIFWGSKRNLEVLRSSLWEYKHHRGFSSLELARELRAAWEPGIPLLGLRTLQRFSQDHTGRLRDHAAMDGILFSLCRLVELSTSTGEMTREPFEQLFALRRSLHEMLQSGEKHLDIPRASEDPQAELIGAMLKMLGVDRGEASRSHRMFFDDEEMEIVTKAGAGPISRCYHLYRPLYRSDRILKSFIQIRLEPHMLEPLCTFAHYVTSGVKENLRVTRGVVLPFPRAIYLCGVIEKSQGLETILIDHPGSRRSTLKGLVMSFDDAAMPVATTFLMKQSAARDWQEASSGIYPEKALHEELGEGLRFLRRQTHEGALSSIDFGSIF